jgi:hypothetical protein
MICPVELASDLSALQAVRVGACTAGFLHEGRDGAGDASTGSNCASHGQEDHLLASGGDYRPPRPALRRWRERYEELGFRGLFDRRRGKPSPKPRTSSFAKNSILLWVTKIFFRGGNPVHRGKQLLF